LASSHLRKYSFKYSSLHLRKCCRQSQQKAPTKPYISFKTPFYLAKKQIRYLRDYIIWINDCLSIFTHPVPLTIIGLGENITLQHCLLVPEGGALGVGQSTN